MGISRQNHLFIRTINLSLLMVMFFFADVSKIFADNFYGSIGIYGNHHLASRVASIRSNGKFSFDNILSITADGSFAAMPLLKTQRLDVSHLSRVIGPLSEKLYSPQVRISNATNPDTSRSSTLNQSISNASSNAVYELRISTTADRTNSILLSEAVLKSKVYIYVQAPTAISSIDFFYDRMPTGTPDRTERIPPFDFSGTALDGSSLAFNTLFQAEGDHVIHALVTDRDAATQLLTVHFHIANQLAQPGFSVTPEQLSATVIIGSPPVNFDVEIGLTDDVIETNQDFTVTSNVAWASVMPASGVAPENVTVTLKPEGLLSGQHQGALTISTDSLTSKVLPLSLLVNGEGGDACAPAVCSEIRVALPYKLDFSTNAGHLEDKSNRGTGFTYVMPSTKATAFAPSKVNASLAEGLLRLTTTNGIMYLGNNNQANALGVGFAAPNQVAKFSTLLINPPAGTGQYEQAGLWFGVDEDNYVKVTYSSHPTSNVVETLYEHNGAVVKSAIKAVENLNSGRLLLELITNPSKGTVTVSYTVNGGVRTQVASYIVASEMFSFDAAGIDPVIGTRSFAGLMATHRNALLPMTYAFDYFHAEVVEAGSSELPIQFSRTSHPINFPTNMAWAPDGKLYVTELFGVIHALTYDANMNVIEDKIINSLVDSMGPRLTLGIAVRHDDPSNKNKYSLWISSSNPLADSGLANSSNVTRLSGSGFLGVQQIITGLPRAITNHAINSLHFGPDNRLYMNVGGNTGAGAPVIVQTDFGDREEQPLSAAMLVADVFANNFDGSCANNTDIYGPAPCNVTTYATGLRNSYDFVFHSNGSLYATDNGLGVIGAYPFSPIPNCRGFSDSALREDGGNNPGAQPDLLLRILPGKYYGHPNPSRSECVFKNGTLQAATPLANYQPPLLELSKNASADGITEYKTAGVCKALERGLLFARYSLGDDIVWVKLSQDGKSVVSQSVLVDRLNDPLSLTEHNGNIFVAESGGGKITVLKPDAKSCF